MNIKRTFFAMLSLLLTAPAWADGAPPGPLPLSTQLAFPTAEGYGRFALGGRGGIVCRVVNLNDSGVGSLRDCLTRTGPRTVIFRVGGTISVHSTIRANGNLTMAGQTAPGGGILIRNGNTRNSAVQFIGNDIIVRHVRFRAGHALSQANNDGIHQEGRRSIFDHVSASWSTDEAADFVYGGNMSTNGDVTFQWSIAAEPLTGTGAHAYCLFVGGGVRVTVHHVLMQDCQMRAPNVATLDQFDMFNSVVHNWAQRSLDIYARFGDVNTSAVGNWWQMGVNSVRGVRNTPIRTNSHTAIGNVGTYRVFVDQNRSWATPTDATPDANILPAAGQVQPASEGGPNERVFVVPNPVHPFSSDFITSPEQAFRDVMQFAGAFPRDAADARIVNETRTCQGMVFRTQSEIPGGWPVIAGGNPYPDADADGMSDTWEIAHGVTSGNADADADGWTNLEEFLNELAGDQDAAGNTLVVTGTGVGTIPAVNCGLSVK